MTRLLWIWLVAFVACIVLELWLANVATALVLAVFAVLDALLMGSELYDHGRRDGAAAARAVLERQAQELARGYGCAPPGTLVEIKGTPVSIEEFMARHSTPLTKADELRRRLEE